jgi:hypothetical protein
VFDIGDPLFVDENLDGAYDAGDTVLYDPSGQLANGDPGVSAHQDPDNVRYVDKDGDSAFDAYANDVYLDRDSDAFVDDQAAPEPYNRITCLAYSATSDRLYCGTQTGGVFRSVVGINDDFDPAPGGPDPLGQEVWQPLDTRLTGVDITRLQWAEIGAGNDEKLYIGGARKGLLMEYDIANQVYTNVSEGESNTKIDTTIMDRTPVLFSGHISPQVVYDSTTIHISPTPDPLAADPETDRFVFAVILEDDFDNPPVMGTDIRVNASHYEITRTVDADGNLEEKIKITDVPVGGYGDWTVGDTMSSGRGHSLYTYVIGPTVGDGDYTGVDYDGSDQDYLEYVEVAVEITFPADSNYGGTGGGEWTLKFSLDMK